MFSDLSHHIQSIRLVDTHEHMRRENDWVENGPDILQDLFGNYVPADLITAGATPEAMKDLIDPTKDIKKGLRQFKMHGKQHNLLDMVKLSVSLQNIYMNLTNCL